MHKFDKTNQTDSPSLSIGEIRTGMGHARQMSASKRFYAPDEYPLRVRGTPEYNPLYDALESDIITTRSPDQNNFRPITLPKSSFISNRHNDTSSTYDKPRSYRYNDEKRQFTNGQRQHSSNYQKRVESTPISEVNLLMDKVDNDTTKQEDDMEGRTQPKKRRRRRILYNLCDFFAILTTCLIFGIIYIFIKPVRRGFFCDDTSIQYPFRPDTIPMWILAIYGGLGPIIIFCCVEIWVIRPFHCGRGRGGHNLKQRQIDYVKTIFHTVFLFILGIAVCFLITEVGKRTIGRLRPYYLTVCNPVWKNLTCTKSVETASGFVIIPQYIMDHNCNTSVSEHDLREARLSFPSGHSSYSTYAFIFLFVYFEARLVCPQIQFLKPFLQCLCVAVAFFTCLSRVTDFKHHATDVIGGSLIGFCIAIFTAVRVGTYLWTFSVYCETEEETKKDRLPKDERVTIPGIETNPSGTLRSNGPDQTITERNSSRSNYDNVLSMHAQQQQRPISNNVKPIIGQRMSPRQGYEEANV
ncbi:unnamed protein product [Rotaria sordida]|uniref:Phosphatidic acid phosphatase type 2/haloperoxidase domain-containing protein n=1 Tax=Rotaria sordida TaxID=392033 RepID=A0A814M153_9BILA|nr:unnamed protein product [Rotaria sordida]CAF1070463.1 unnamed protein product [Rotaria sordida]